MGEMNRARKRHEGIEVSESLAQCLHYGGSESWETGESCPMVDFYGDYCLTFPHMDSFAESKLEGKICQYLLYK